MKRKGIPESQIVTWSENGIEHYYPEAIMREIFGGIGEIIISGDEITMCGVMERKLELARKVASKITKETKFSEEFENKIFALINRIKN